MATTKMRKTSVRIWDPILNAFNARIDSACLRRDAWLAKILEREIYELESESTFQFLDPEDGSITDPIKVANSEAARRFIASHLDALKPRRLVTLTLPESLVERIDAFCKERRVVRDSFFNRLMFLLGATDDQITQFYFDGDSTWERFLLGHEDFRAAAAKNYIQRIPENADPLHAIRAVSDRAAWPDPQDPDETLEFGPPRVYTTPIVADVIPGVDLSGLIIFLPDSELPAEDDMEQSRSLEELLPSRQSKNPGPMTQHARQRMQQRGFTPDQLELLIAYGTRKFDHRGAELYYFSKATNRHLARKHGALVADSLRKVYAVRAVDGQVITVGHRTKPIRSDRSQRDLWRAKRQQWPDRIAAGPLRKVA